jgi:3,4-dihydroxy 2-butanone 4-phosphate synthase/GTP cyclohydrolase II
MQQISEENEGVFVYLRGHEGRGIGLGNKVQAYSLQDQGRDTVQANLDLGFPADQREYEVGAKILLDLGVSTIRLMTNNPAKCAGLIAKGMTIVERVPLLPPPTKENRKYLATKRDQLGHLLPDDYLPREDEEKTL